MKWCPEIGVLFFAFFCCFGTTKFWINRHANQLRYMFWTKTKFPVIRPFVWIYRFRFTDGEQFIHRWCIGGRTHFNPFLLFLLRGQLVPGLLLQLECCLCPQNYVLVSRTA